MGYQWLNPYRARIAEYRSILSCLERKLSNEEKAVLDERVRAHNEIYCELCSGSGGHLIEQARARPDALFIGFELRFKRVVRTAEKAEQLGLKNLLLVRTDARAVPHLFAPGTISGIFIFFPDPWSKNRWRKHRFLTPEFISALWPLLRPAGTFAFKTDVASYFTEVREALAGQPGAQILFSTENLEASPHGLGNIRSEFESLFCSKGLPTYALKVRRIL